MSIDQFFGWEFFAGIAVGVGFIYFLSWRSATGKLKEKQKLYHNIDQVMEIPVATIAKDLLILFKNYIRSDVKLYIVGSGEYCKSNNASYWFKCLNSWLTFSIEIHYIMIHPSKEAVVALRKQIEANPSKFIIHEICNTHSGDDFSRIVELFNTLHPTLLESKSGNLMWLEYFHPRNSANYSYDNVFIPPQAMKGIYIDKYNTYMKYIQILIDHSLPIEIGTQAFSEGGIAE